MAESCLLAVMLVSLQQSSMRRRVWKLQQGRRPPLALLSYPRPRQGAVQSSRNRNLIPL
jgi:hypothetical protein